MGEVLAYAEKRLSLPCKERLQIWSDTLMGEIVDKDFLDSKSADIANLVALTLPLYSDAASQQAVRAFVRAAMGRSETFVRAMAALVVRLATSGPAKAPGGLPRQEAFVLLQWSALVLLQLDPESAKKAVSKLLEIQTSLLDQLSAASAAGGAPRWAAVCRVPVGMLLRKPALVPELLAAAKAATGGSGAGSGAARTLHEYARRRPAEASALGLPSELLALYLDKVLGPNSRERPGPEVAAAYRSLMVGLRPEDLTATVLPAISRMLRRVPDVALGALLGLLQGAGPSLDASAAARELVGVVVQQVRAKESVRALGMDCLRQLAGHTQQLEVERETVAGVRKVLDGSAEGKLKVAAERALVAGCLGALAEVPPQLAADAGFAALAEDVCGFVAGAVKDELSEDVKLALLACLAAWLPHAAAAPPAATALLHALLRDPKELLRRAASRALLAAPAHLAAPLLAASPAVAEPCLKWVGDSLGKPALRLDGTLGALLVARALAAEEAAGGQAVAGAVAKEEKVWVAALRADSALLQPANAAKLMGPDALLPAQLAEVLLAAAGRAVAAGGACGPLAAALSKAEGGLDAACRLLMACCVHWSRDVRRAAQAAVRGLVSEFPGALMAPLCCALRGWMTNRAALPVAADPAASGEDATATAGQLAMRFGDALAALTPQALAQRPGALAALEGEQLGALLLAGQHPALDAPQRTAPKPWRQVLSRLGPGFDSRVHACASAVCALLSGPEGLQAASLEERRAACGALGAAVTAAPSAMFEHVQAALRRLLERSELFVLTDDDKEVYETPEGILSSERVPAGVYVPQVVVNKNVKKARGRMRMDNRAFADGGDSEEEEEVVVAPKPAAKQPPKPAPGGPKPAHGKKDAAAREAEWRQNKLAAESANRARIRALKARLELGLGALGAVVESAPRAASVHLEHYQELCLPLMSSWLVGEAAFEAVRALSTCMPGRLGSDSAITLTACLRLVAQAQQGKGGLGYQDIAFKPAVASVVHALAAVTTGADAGAGVPGSGQQLPPSSYCYVFPVLQAVLLSPVYSPLHDEALGVVALHCGPGLDIPRRASLELMYHLLGVVPAYRDRIQPLLRSLCAGCLEADMPAALAGLTHPAAHVRGAALAALPSLPLLAEGAAPQDDDAAMALLWLACHDAGSEANQEAARGLWREAGAQLGSGALFALVPWLCSEAREVQDSAAAALASGLALHPGASSQLVAAVTALYDPDASLAARLGVADALRACAPALAEADVSTSLDFLIGSGLADHDEGVREQMVGAGMAILDGHGALHAPRLLPLFESHLDRKGRAKGDAEEEERFDLVRQGVVVLLGTIARHLPPADPKRSSALDMLLGVLGTPSEAVQRSVSNCLPPLVAPLAGDSAYMQGLVQRLLTQLTKGATFGERRGAAFGLAGVVKGLGIMSMKNYNIMEDLKAAVEDKKDPLAREGGLLAFECLSDKLGKLFEPYVIHVLPVLLNCFGDASPQVRQATEDAARVIMGQLTASGVKLVLPALLKGLEDKVWRTKQGSVQLLGAMAHCAPKQLGSCLPTIVPKLGEVLSDPHPKVQAAAQEALSEVGSVIRNPEVQRLVPHLLGAIADPNSATRPCLDVLLDTVFINTIDAPSLALIAPVVHRGLRDRMGDTKKRAARIVGNMCSLVNDPKDMGPYVPLLMPELQKSLVDPIPEVRAVSARAIGSLMRGMGQEAFGSLVPWLMETLTSEASSVERSGAAQGLAEVLCVLGPDHLEALLPEVLAGCAQRSRPAAREGSLTLFQYLPLTLHDPLQRHLPRVLQSVLDGLSDEVEGVRDAALGAGRIIIDYYAQSALPLLLPAVEDGILNDNWRIRGSSVKLLGKLLFKVAGASGNVVLDGHEDDEGIAEESYGEAIISALGMDRRNEVLARLYMIRSDVQYVVRNEALHVWKTVVVNTPRTLGQMLPDLMQLLITSLGHSGEDRRTTAGRCLGDLVRKMGERVLQRIVPIMREGVSSPDAATRQGVCFGLKEVLDNMGRNQLQEHLAEVLPTVQIALTDADPTVREAAGEAFGILFKGGAGSAVDSVVPGMLAGLEHDKRFAESLEGLRVILQVRPQIFHFVCPKLLHRPLLLNNIRALGELAEAAGTHLNNHLAAIMPALLAAASGVPGVCAAAAEGDEGGEEDLALGAAVAVCLAVDEEGLHLLLPEIVKGLDEPGHRRGATLLVTSFIGKCSLDLSEHLPQLMTSLVLLLAEDAPPEDLIRSWRALEAVCTAIPKDDQPDYVSVLKNAVADAREKERRKRRGGPLLVAGLCVPPKALAPLLPIYLQGVLQGSSAELREAAAEGLGDLVAVTSEDALKPFVVQMTGPLIRIIGDRFPSPIKAAILATLGGLIAKAGPGLKPFVPQLQTTFLKCLNDPADNVRTRAADNLGELTRMSARLEQLAQDLASSGRTAEPEMRCAHLRALRGALLAAGDRLAPAALAAVADTLKDTMRLAGGDDDEYRIYVGSCLGALCKVAPPDTLKGVLAAGPLAPVAPSLVQARQLNGIILATTAQYAAGRLEEAGLIKPFADAISRAARDEDTGVKTAAARAAARLAAAVPSALPGCMAVLQALLGPDQGAEVVRQTMLAVRRLACESPAGSLDGHLGALLPSICAVLAGGATGITKSTAEAALQKLLRVESGLDAAQAYLAGSPSGVAKQTLTDSFLRRLQKLTEEDLFASEDY